MKVCIKFSKGGALRFIGHLDFLRVVGQALRRTGLPLAYSQGFNPHILLGFALPLPLGMASLHDYADVVFAEVVALGDAAARLQACAPQGLKILEMFEYEGKNPAAVTAAADYTLRGEVVTNLLVAHEWIIPKKTKSGVKDTDIRPDVFDISADAGVITMRLAAGSGRFLHPLTAASIITGREVTTGEITRAELYRRVNAGFVPLG